jgi:Trk K+ transport system NAD-binding subunit
LDGILEFGGQQMRLEEFVIGQNSPLAGLTLREARLSVTVLAVSHPDQALLTHPNSDTRLLPGAAIIVMGIDPELNKLARIVKG